jgi:hypothetical protein
MNTNKGEEIGGSVEHEFWRGINSRVKGTTNVWRLYITSITMR